MKARHASSTPRRRIFGLGFILSWGGGESGVLEKGFDAGAGNGGGVDLVLLHHLAQLLEQLGLAVAKPARGNVADDDDVGEVGDRRVRITAPVFDRLELRSVGEILIGLLEMRLPAHVVWVWLENEEHPVGASPWCGSREVS